MANEAACIETPSRFARYTIAAGATLPVGTLMYLSGDNTASATSAVDQAFVGIVWEIASTSTTTFKEITLAQDGVWAIKDAGAGSTRGVLLAVGGANLSVTADADDVLNGAAFGYAETTSAGAATVRTRLTKFGGSGQL